jgi:hypothetical protein
MLFRVSLPSVNAAQSIRRTLTTAYATGPEHDGSDPATHRTNRRPAPYGVGGVVAAGAAGVTGGVSAATAGAVVGATAVAAGFPPFRNAGNQSVLNNTAACTSNATTATDPRNSGTPTDGFTTRHILP